MYFSETAENQRQNLQSSQRSCNIVTSVGENSNTLILFPSLLILVLQLNRNFAFKYSK